MKRTLKCTAGTAAVEAAIFMPIFFLFILGITDLGASMFVRTQINAAAQSGAMAPILNSSRLGGKCAGIVAVSPETPVITADCLNVIKAAMNDAIGNNDPDHPFCTGAVCTAELVT